MIFTDLEIKNFLSIGEAHVNLKDRGLIAIQGVNDDDSSAGSNGSGKSSIPDAVSWVLFGVTARNVSGDDVINRRVGKKCSVTLTIIDDDDCYQICRSRKPNLLTVHKITKTERNDMTKGTSAETQKLIEDILGCSRDIFMSTTYAGQENMPDLPGMTDKHLKELIEEAAGINALTEAYRIARERALDVKSEVNVIEREITATEEHIETFKTLKDHAVRDFEAFKKSYNKESLKCLADMLEDRQTALKDKRKEYAVIEEKLSAHNELLSGMTARCFENLKKLNACSSSVASLTSEIEHLKKEIGRENNELKAIQKAYDEGVCPECGQKLSEDLMEHRSGNKKAHLEKSREDHKAETLKKFKLLKVKQTEKKKLEEENRVLIEKKDKITAAGAVLVNEQEKLALSIRALEDSVRASLDAKNKLDNDDKMCAYREAEIKKFEKQIDETTAKMLLKKNDLVTKQGELSRISSVVDVFSPAGIRAYVLDSVTPFLNERTAYYLNALSGGSMTAVWSTLARTKGGVLKEKFNISVINRFGANSFNGLSGGEKRKVRLSCSLALQELSASRGTKRIDLFMADEIDNALDETSLQLLMDLMSEKAQQCRSLFVISHNSLNDMVDNIMTVRKHDGMSSVEV